MWAESGQNAAQKLYRLQPVWSRAVHRPPSQNAAQNSGSQAGPERPAVVSIECGLLATRSRQRASRQPNVGPSAERDGRPAGPAVRLHVSVLLLLKMNFLCRTQNTGSNSINGA